jgi:hypothetical protein
MRVNQAALGRWFSSKNGQSDILEGAHRGGELPSTTGTLGQPRPAKLILAAFAVQLSSLEHNQKRSSKKPVQQKLIAPNSRSPAE